MIHDKSSGWSDLAGSRGNNLPGLFCSQGWRFKGTVRVILSDSPCKDGNVGFTTVPLKPLTDQGCQIYSHNSTNIKSF